MSEIVCTALSGGKLHKRLMLKSEDGRTSKARYFAQDRREGGKRAYIVLRRTWRVSGQMKAAEAPTIPQIVAGQVRRFREAHEPRWSQADLAGAMRENGFSSWNQQLVAALESGRRQSGVTVPELIGLAVVFRRPVVDFLMPSADGGPPHMSVVLNDWLIVQTSTIYEAFTGEVPTVWGVEDAEGKWRPVTLPRAFGPSEPPPSELDTYAGRVLKLKPREVARLAKRIDEWGGRSAAEERNRLMTELGLPRKAATRRVVSRLRAEALKLGGR